MNWIVNLLLSIISSIWMLWVCLFGRADSEAPFVKWFLKCIDAKNDSGGIYWNEFLALMKYLTLHYIGNHDEAEKYRSYTEYVDMTPFQYRGYTEDDWDKLVNQIYTAKRNNRTQTQQNKPVTKSKSSYIPQSQTNNHQTDEFSSFEEKRKSKAWLWILLALLLAGCGAIWYLFNSDSQEPVSSETPIEKETISEPKVIDIEKENEEMLSFIKEFYQHYLDENYLRKNVSESVINKLIRDYPYDCEDGDCLATWVFSAYPPGTDLELEEGPVITQNGGGTFKVGFKYSYIVNGQKYYEDRSIRVYVAMSDGRYKVVSYDYDENTQAPRNDEEKLISEIPEGKYHLSCADMHVILNVHDSVVEGEYYFHAGSSMSTSVKLYGEADNGLQLHLRQWNAVNEEDLGYMDGTFDGKTFKGEYDKEGYRRSFEVYVNE